MTSAKKPPRVWLLIDSNEGAEVYFTRAKAVKWARLDRRDFGIRCTLAGPYRLAEPKPKKRGKR